MSETRSETFKRCHYVDCQAGYVILGTAPLVRVGWDIGHKRVVVTKNGYADEFYHPGCWAAKNV